MSWSGTSTYIDSLPMMKTPYMLLSIFGVYLLIVLDFGPNFMRNRQPYNLRNIVRVYNIYQVVGCILCVSNAPRVGFMFKHFYQCDTEHNWVENHEAVDGFWWFILFRMSEFLETLFFVLRKKQNQVSFLHIYHHLAVVSLLWIYLKYDHSLAGFFIGVLNSYVHIVMYSYYFLSSFKSMQAVTNVVKRYITIIQITQLLTLTAHCLIAIFVCGEQFMYYLQAFNLIFLVTLFLVFYKESYSNQKSEKKLKS